MICAEPQVKEDLRNIVINDAKASARRSIAALGGPLSAATVTQFLTNSNCLKYPTRVRYAAQYLKPYQFAQAYFARDFSEQRCTLFVHPRYAQSLESLPVIVAYMAAVINYGGAVTPELCDVYGAALMGMTREAFCDEVWKVAHQIAQVS